MDRRERLKGICHDISTPTTLLMGNIEMLGLALGKMRTAMEGLGIDDQVLLKSLVNCEKMIDGAHHGARQIFDLVRVLKDLAKSEE